MAGEREGQSQLIPRLNSQPRRQLGFGLGFEVKYSLALLLKSPFGVSKGQIGLKVILLRGQTKQNKQAHPFSLPGLHGLQRHERFCRELASRIFRGDAPAEKHGPGAKPATRPWHCPLFSFSPLRFRPCLFLFIADPAEASRKHGPGEVNSAGKQGERREAREPRCSGQISAVGFSLF